MKFGNLTLLQEVEKPHAKSDIILEDLSTHPCCDHGPTILFKRNSSEFYSCSAFRNRNQCSFYIKKADFLKKSSSTKAELSKQKPIRFVKNPKFFCHQCQILDSKGHENHPTKSRFFPGIPGFSGLKLMLMNFHRLIVNISLQTLVRV